MRIAEVMKEIRGINAAHGFEAEGDKIFCEKLMLVITELAEAMEAFRLGRRLGEVWYENGKPEGIPVEIADAVIRLFDWCEANGIDLEDMIRMKLDYNMRRPYLHGKKL